MIYLLKRNYLLLFFLTLSACSLQEKKVSFNEEIKPLINKRCITCHGGVKRNAEIGRAHV